YVVLGSKVRSELFGITNPLGEVVRIGSFRFRVIGVMESKGQILGFDLDDAVYIPAAKSLEMFNRESLMEIDVLYSATASAEAMSERVRQLLIDRHGHEDFTITTQEKMLGVLGDVLDKLTLAVGALGGISLLVGGVGVLTIMTISVRDRTSEIGLLRALGATRSQILHLFLKEAVFLSVAGGAAGLIIGWTVSRLIHQLVPALPTRTSMLYVVLSLVVSGVIGLAAGVIPARQAADMDPQEALRAE
ncbi:MAG: FtsX-like permease family protein, partial [Desulfobulbaceae bacterium]|nr:FtsX-like permease family protein [Desulfobulbaceae bacterium]